MRQLSKLQFPLGNGKDIDYYQSIYILHVQSSMGGGTFGLDNGLGGQSIVHTQWVPPQLQCQSERSAAHAVIPSNKFFAV